MQKRNVQTIHTTVSDIPKIVQYCHLADKELSSIIPVTTLAQNRKAMIKATQSSTRLAFLDATQSSAFSSVKTLMLNRIELLLL